MVIDQLRSLIDSPYSRYISPYALIREFSDYMSSLIHSADDQSKMVLMSDIMVEGMKYIQNHIIHQSNVERVKYETEALQLSLLGRNMSFVKDDLAAMFKAGFDKIGYADKSDLFVFLYDTPLDRKDGPGTIGSSPLRLVAKRTTEGGTFVYADDERPEVTDEHTVLDYASECENDKSDKYCFADIHHADRVYGLIVSRMDEEDVTYLTLLSLQIAMLLAMRNG